MNAFLLVIEAGLIAAASCRRQPPPTPLGPRPTEATVAAGITATGTVRVIGADPRPQVILDVADGTRRALVGLASSELAQLAGAKVRVRGEAAATPPPETNGLTIESYEILEVAGTKPILGRLHSEEGVLFVDTTRVINLPPELVRAVGAKVWVGGRPGPRGLIVTAYGILASTSADSAHR